MNGSVFPPRILHETTVIIVTAFVPADTAHGVSRRDPTKGERRLACPCEQGCGNMATSLEWHQPPRSWRYDGLSTLVIVESPAKARTIGRFLGRNYSVKASMGHVRDLPRSQFGVDIENNFTPKYITVRGQGKRLQELRAAAKKADRVLLATDPDREGEAISWHLAEALKLDTQAPQRIEFNEITRSAVERAIENPRPINFNLVNAQQARRVLDRLVGYKLSPLLWEKIKPGLSAGRVQSAALRMICDRETEINEFKPEEYWSLTVWLSRRACSIPCASYSLRGKGCGAEKRSGDAGHS